MFLTRFTVLAGLICFLFSTRSFSQIAIGAAELSQIKNIEDTLLVYADSMYSAPIPEYRTGYCETMVRHLVRALRIPGSYAYGFDKLKEKINIIGPDDNSFRIFNWAIAPSENTRRYYGAVQMASEQLKLYPLVDYTKELSRGAEDSVLTGGKWFGALYYRVLANQVEDRKYYTLFGVNSSSAISNKKVMDPLYFTETGVVFGAPIFNLNSESRPEERINRFIIEYKKEVQASLNWDNDMNAVFFDKLVSQVNDPNRKYTYVPSGQYDGFRWSGNQWMYVRDLIPVQTFKDGEAPEPQPVKGKQ
jgi:hypothetical protein